MQASNYIQILQDHLLEIFMDFYIKPQLYIFQQDNDSKHSASDTKK